MCIDPHQTGSVGKGSDHLQLTQFWTSCAPGKGVCGGAKIFGSALLQAARSVCISLSTFSCYVSDSGNDVVVSAMTLLVGGRKCIGPVEMCPCAGSA